MFRATVAATFLLLTTLPGGAALPPLSTDLAEPPQRCWQICDAYKCALFSDWTWCDLIPND